MIGIEYVEIEVPELSHAIRFYSQSFHMRIIGTYHNAEKKSCLLQCGNIKLIISANNKQCSEFSNDVSYESHHIVREIAFLTEDTEACYHHAIASGQQAITPPFKLDLMDDQLCAATVSGIG